MRNPKVIENVRLESVSMVTNPLKAWVCVQENCDGIHHYYEKQVVTPVSLV